MNRGKIEVLVQLNLILKRIRVSCFTKMKTIEEEYKKFWFNLTLKSLTLCFKIFFYFVYKIMMYFLSVFVEYSPFAVVTTVICPFC